MSESWGTKQFLLELQAVSEVMFPNKIFTNDVYFSPVMRENCLFVFRIK